MDSALFILHALSCAALSELTSKQLLPSPRLTNSKSSDKEMLLIP